MSQTARGILLGALVALLGALLWTVARNARLDAEIAAAKERHVADSTTAAEAKRELEGAVALSDSLRRAHAEGERRQAAAKAASDRAAVRLRAERDSALALVADTGATVPELKATIVTLVAAGDSAAVAWALERRMFERRLDERLVIMQRDSVVLRGALNALEAMERRALAAERLADLWQARAKGQWVWKALAAAGAACGMFCR